MVLIICESEERRANANSVAMARYAVSQLPKKAGLKINDFLPYPNQQKSGKDKAGMQPKTAKSLKRLIKQRILPPRVEAAAIRDTGILDG